MSSCKAGSNFLHRLLVILIMNNQRLRLNLGRKLINPRSSGLTPCIDSARSNIRCVYYSASNPNRPTKPLNVGLASYIPVDIRTNLSQPAPCLKELKSLRHLQTNGKQPHDKAPGFHHLGDQIHNFWKVCIAST